MSLNRLIFTNTSTSRESSCVRYFERFCERARAEMITADGVRSLINLECNPQRPAAPRPKGAHGAGVDSKSNVVPGMRVTQQVVEAARRWALTSPEDRRKEPGMAERLAEQVGVARGTLTRVGRRILKGDL